MIDDRAGTYALVLFAKQPFEVEIGSLGSLAGSAGNYVYVGSAFGAGGLRGRISHHLRLSTRPHWHIDYLRRLAVPTELWLLQGKTRYEHRWATILQTMPESDIPLARFGSSDCRCPTHLFYFETRPRFGDFRRQLRLHRYACAGLTRIELKQTGEVDFRRQP